MAYQLLETALEFPEAGVRSQGAADAAPLFEEAGRDDLAADAEALAREIAANEPKAMLQCALSAAQSHAEQGKWEDVVKGPQGPVTGQGPSKPLLQATVLLAQANQKLGNMAEVRKWMDRAAGLVGQVDLSSAESANCYCSIASLAEGANRKTLLLE